MNRGNPVRVRQRQALPLRYRNQRIARPAAINGAKIFEIEASVDSRYRALGKRLEKWKVNEVEMKMKDIELSRTCANLEQHREVRGEIGT